MVDLVSGKVFIMFLFKAAFWLTVVVAFIPVDPALLGEDDRNVSPSETISLARSVVQDMASFCERNAKSCETGGIIVSQLGLKAREGAKMVYTYLDNNVVVEPNNAVASKKDGLTVGSIAK